MKVLITKGPLYDKVVKDAQFYFYQFATKQTTKKGA